MQMNFTTNFGNRTFTSSPVTTSTSSTPLPFNSTHSTQTHLVNTPVTPTTNSFVLRDRQSLINRSLNLGIIINAKNQPCLSCSGAK